MANKTATTFNYLRLNITFSSFLQKMIIIVDNSRGGLA